MKRRIMFCCPEDYYDNVILPRARGSKKFLALVSESAYVLRYNGLVQVYVGDKVSHNHFNCIADHNLPKGQFKEVRNFLLNYVDIDASKLFTVMREGPESRSYGTLDCSSLGVTFPLIPPRLNETVAKMIEHAKQVDGDRFHTIVEGDRVTIASHTWWFLNDNLKLLMTMVGYAKYHSSTGISFVTFSPNPKLGFVIKYPFQYTDLESSLTHKHPKYFHFTEIDAYASEKADPEGYKALFECKQGGDIMEGFDMVKHMKYPIESEEGVDFDHWIWYTDDEGYQQQSYERICALLNPEKE